MWKFMNIKLKKRKEILYWPTLQASAFKGI